MTGPIETFPNLGPKMARLLADVRLASEDDLRRIGPADAYARLCFAADPPISLNALYAIHAALAGCDWREVSQAAKAALWAKVRRSAGS